MSPRRIRPCKQKKKTFNVNETLQCNFRFFNCKPMMTTKMTMNLFEAIMTTMMASLAVGDEDDGAL